MHWCASKSELCVTRTIQSSLITNCPHHISLPSNGCISVVASKGNSKSCFKARSFFLFWTWALVGLISLSEINKYWLSATSAHDTRLSLYSWHSTPGLWMPFSHLLSLASSGRKKKNEISGNFSSAHSPPASWPTGQAPGSRDSQTLYFSGFFLFHEDFIF